MKVKMKITMKEILERCNDCNEFSLSGAADGYIVSKEEVTSAIAAKKEKNKQSLKNYYDKNNLNQNGYPEFDKLYSEIEKECKDFIAKENRETSLNKLRKLYKEMGYSDEYIDLLFKNTFNCSSISDLVGKTTKYGKKNEGYFWNFYHNISNIIDIENNKMKFCISNGKNPIEQIPNELKKYLLRYEVSFYNEVTESSNLIINYYFALNNKTKEYLLKFKTEFDLTDLEDLAIYKGNIVKFYSCTHEKFNSYGQY